MNFSHSLPHTKTLRKNTSGNSNATLEETNKPNTNQGYHP